MIEQIMNAPSAFWLAVLVLSVLVAEGLRNWHEAWAKPALVVYGTVAVWYFGDYLSSTPMSYHQFAPVMVQVSFIQVAAFMVLVRFLYPKFVRKFCHGLTSPLIPASVGRRRKQPAARSKWHGVDSPISQRTLFRILLAIIVLWVFLFTVGTILQEGRWLPLLWPPVQREKVGMFVHAAVGTNTSFVTAAAGYIHLLISALFGLAALLGKGKVRWIALVMVCLSWPYFLFDRTRNLMLALFLPAVGGYWSFSRHRVIVKVAVSMVLLLVIDAWFRQVMLYRTDEDVRVFTHARGGREVQHHGLDLLKELCWINTFIANGRYEVNWGERYFAEAVNFVPRAIWPDKPKIGWDYAKTRGFMPIGNRLPTATISTGMIGQGLVNFGRYLGVLAAATIMSAWIGILSRLWLQRASLLRKLLFLMGLGLTFNMGRDVTLLVLFPFVFGYLGIRVVEMMTPQRKPPRRPPASRIDPRSRRQVLTPLE